MATAVVLPRLGQTVESCIIVDWKKEEGDSVTEGEPLCEVETDKAMLDVESPASGTLLELFFQQGDEVPVQINIAAIGEPGEDVSSLRPDTAAEGVAVVEPPPVPDEAVKAVKAIRPDTADLAPILDVTPAQTDLGTGISPRARNLAKERDLEITGIEGTGPGGRIIERDVQAVLATLPPITPLAKSMVAQGAVTAPAYGSGIGGRVIAGDLRPVSAEPETTEDEVQKIPLKGVRKVIAERMLSSMQTTAQLTLNASADARSLLAYRQRLKNSPEALDLQGVTINDLILFAVSRTLPEHPELNALFAEEAIFQYNAVHLASAVDTPRGLIVPVIRNADALSLKEISQEARRQSSACLEGNISPDELAGGTFTVTNLGSLGIENFTPILNPPQVGILGVGNVNLKPVEIEGDVKFIPHIGLSLTINHQVVDGAPAARFLQTLSQRLAEIDLLLAL